jgi:ubiquinone/menaquinone biosynthesis C-methylase UbiE
MGLPFDHIASAYDSVYTQTAIGQLQRKRVWKYIESIMPQLSGYEMLELNIGVGEDALMFGDKGFNIVATDISTEMQKVTFERPEQFSMHNGIGSHYLDLESFDETLFDKKFDLVFSNFGGINCMNPESLKALLSKLPGILNPGGRFVGVIMPRFCAWETVFFALRFQFKKAFRRFTSHAVLTDTYGTKEKTWFYRPSQIKKWSQEKFKLVSLGPVGTALPPFSLNNLFGHRKKLLFYLNRVEKNLSRIPFLSAMSDHFVIDLQLRK